MLGSWIDYPPILKSERAPALVCLPHDHVAGCRFGEFIATSLTRERSSWGSFANIPVSGIRAHRAMNLITVVAAWLRRETKTSGDVSSVTLVGTGLYVYTTERSERELRLFRRVALFAVNSPIINLVKSHEIPGLAGRRFAMRCVQRCQREQMRFWLSRH